MSQQNNPARIRAKRLMRHYFMQVFRIIDRQLNNDNFVELDNLVDDIIEAAVAEATEDYETRQAREMLEDHHAR